MERVQIVTVSTAPQHKYQKLQKQTAKKWGYSYASIGQGTPWSGFVTKMELPIDYLKAQLEADAEAAQTTLYVFVDAYDLVFAGPPEELLAKYKAFAAPIVVGAERVCFGNCLPSTCTLDDRTGAARQYINTGCVMGPVQDLLTYYDWGRVNYPADDQVAMSKFRNQRCDLVVLDSQATIVLNYEAAWLWNQNDALDRLENGRFRVKQTGSVPCLIHCPFIFQDLGWRWDYILSHVLPEHIPSETKGQHFHSLVKHSTKQIRSNKTYFVFTLALSYASLLFIIALICGCVYGFRAGKSWMERYENGF